MKDMQFGKKQFSDIEGNEIEFFYFYINSRIM